MLPICVYVMMGNKVFTYLLTYLPPSTFLRCHCSTKWLRFYIYERNYREWRPQEMRKPSLYPRLCDNTQPRQHFGVKRLKVGTRFYFLFVILRFNGLNVNCFLLLLAIFIIQQHLFSLISGSLDSGRQCQKFVLLILLLMIVNIELYV